MSAFGATRCQWRSRRGSSVLVERRQACEDEAAVRAFGQEKHLWHGREQHLAFAGTQTLELEALAIVEADEEFASDAEPGIGMVTAVFDGGHRTRRTADLIPGHGSAFTPSL
jgi:hypothetical protein